MSENESEATTADGMAKVASAVPFLTEDSQDQGEPDLQDAGKKALTSERRARAAAEKQVKALQAQLDEIATAQLNKEEQASKRADEAEARALKAEASEMKWKVARTIPGITDEEVELFLTAADEETLLRQAEALKARSIPEPGKGTHVPGVGNAPKAPPTLHEQIRAAELAGDAGLAISLKSQQLADLAKQTK